MDLNLRQKDIASQIGVNKATITNWERQRTTPEIRFIARIIEFLGYNPLPSPSGFSGKLIAYRTRPGLSQTKFAAIIGVDPTTLAGWEAGRHQPCHTNPYN